MCHNQILAILSSSLLIISELLPYIRSIKGDGIVQVVSNILKR